MTVTDPAVFAAAWRRARWLALALGCAAFAASLAIRFVVVPQTWPMTAGHRWLVLAPAFIVPPGALVVLFVAAVPRGFRRAVQGLLLGTAGGQPAFVVPRSLIESGLLAILMMSQAGQLVLLERDGDRVRLLPGTLIESAIAVSVVIAVAAWLVLRGRPAVVLRPAGMVVRHLFRTRRMAWADLVSGDEYPLGWFKARRLAVDPGFLADVIEYYRRHGEHRAAIGTRGEYDRLTAVPAPRT